MLEKNLESRIEKEGKIEDFVREEWDLVGRRLDILKHRGKLPNYLIFEDAEDVLTLQGSDKRLVYGNILELMDWRTKNGYRSLGCYHTSSWNYKVGDKVPLDSEGKAHFSDIYALYTKNSTIDYVYKVKAEGKFLDENAPKSLEDHWFYSRTPLVVEKVWTREEFEREYTKARFL